MEEQSEGQRSGWTFEMVQERLVEAMLLWRRMPDRERGWLAVKAYWPEMRRHNHFGDYADVEASPRPLPLSLEDDARMGIGQTVCRERGGPYVYDSVYAVS